MIKFFLSQVALTSLTLGALKKHGLIILETSHIKNETLKYTIVKGVELGENAVGLMESLYHQAHKQVSEMASKK